MLGIARVLLGSGGMALCLLVALQRSALGQQGDGTRPPAVAVTGIALYNARANLREATDSIPPRLANALVHEDLARAPGLVLLDSALVARAEASPAARAAGAGRSCDVVVACARDVGRLLGARWVVMGKLSKTSNLIWVLTGQLIDVRAGDVIIDDSYELKGDAEKMVPAAARIFADRVARRIRGEHVSGSR